MRDKSHLRRQVFRAKNRGHLILHAGLHKTGSTSLQTSLRQAGLLLPAHRSDFRSYSSMREKLTLAQARGLVASSEHFLGEMIEFYDSAPERIEWLTRSFDSVKLIVYLRPHLSWHESAFAQLIQQGTICTESEYLERTQRSRVADFRKLVRLVGEFNRVSAIGWIRCSPDVVDDFSTILGYKLPRGESRNRSLHPLALEAIRRLSRTQEFSHQEMRLRLARWVPENGAEYSVFSAETQSYFLSKEEEWLECAQILSAFQEIPAGWEQVFRCRIKPWVQEDFTEEHMDSALALLREEEFEFQQDKS